MKRNKPFSRYAISLFCLSFILGITPGCEEIVSLEDQQELNAPMKSYSSSIFNSTLNSDEKNLKGVVDLHAHPMAHLAHGQKVIFGVPDVGTLMPHGTVTCQTTHRYARNIAEALGSCYGIHGGHDFFKNPCGNHTRRMVLNGVEDGNNANKPHDVEHPDGFPTFSRWPKHNDILHQTMWIDWLKRSWEGGLRVMVGLAVNSRILAVGIEGDNPIDDKTSGDIQLDEMIKLAGRHDWIEVARSANDLRRIVSQDKLALILGVELDDIGNFVLSQRVPNEDEIRYEIRRLYEKGVRYILPIHIVDNFFGGTAVFNPEFARANRYQNGKWWDLVCAEHEDAVTQQLSFGWDAIITIALGGAGGTQPTPACQPGIGYVNNFSLTTQGRIAIDEMMRLGMLIDIDHMSLETVKNVLDYTRPNMYPFISGHNGPSTGSGLENQRQVYHYAELAVRGGMAGVTWADSDAKSFLKTAERTQNTGISIALGTDANGMSKAPRPRKECSYTPCVVYSDKFTKSSTANKTWDYNVDGVAHYGMIPDFIKDVENLEGEEVVANLFNGAEALAELWEHTEEISTNYKSSTGYFHKKITALLELLD